MEHIFKFYQLIIADKCMYIEDATPASDCKSLSPHVPNIMLPLLVKNRCCKNTSWEQNHLEDYMWLFSNACTSLPLFHNNGCL